MRGEEFLPVISGLVLGCLVRYFNGRAQKWAIALATVVLAIWATVASGEFRQSWGFLLLDIAIVATAALVGFAATGRVQSWQMTKPK
jgi:hypothetical protein